MNKTDYKVLVAEIEAQIEASGDEERDRLHRHLKAVRQRAALEGVRIRHPGARPEQDRCEENVEAQFNNMPV